MQAKLVLRNRSFDFTSQTDFYTTKLPLQEITGLSSKQVWRLSNYRGKYFTKDVDLLSLLYTQRNKQEHKERKAKGLILKIALAFQSITTKLISNEKGHSDWLSEPSLQSIACMANLSCRGKYCSNIESDFWRN